MSGTFTNLPPYFHNPDYAAQEYYQELFNRILSNWFRTDIGFFLPTLTNAQVVTLTGLTPAVQPGRIWFNSDLGKAQILVAVGTVETITSV
jgi:hypothetical protein